MAGAGAREWGNVADEMIVVVSGIVESDAFVFETSSVG